MVNRWGHGPVYHRFKEQQYKAKQRGIAWRLAYWEWLQIWQDSGHLDERGCGKGQWVMGRNGDAGAYEAGNVKIIRVESNNSGAHLAKQRLQKSRRKVAGGLIEGRLDHSA